jgi:hypothetical protein
MVETDDLDRLEQKFSNRFNTQFDKQFNDYFSLKTKNTDNDNIHHNIPPILLVKKESYRFSYTNDYKTSSSTYKRKIADDTDSSEDTRNRKVARR